MLISMLAAERAHERRQACLQAHNLHLSKHAAPGQTAGLHSSQTSAWRPAPDAYLLLLLKV